MVRETGRKERVSECSVMLDCTDGREVTTNRRVTKIKPSKKCDTVLKVVVAVILSSLFVGGAGLLGHLVGEHSANQASHQASDVQTVNHQVTTTNTPVLASVASSVSFAAKNAGITTTESTTAAEVKLLDLLSIQTTTVKLTVKERRVSPATRARTTHTSKTTKSTTANTTTAPVKLFRDSCSFKIGVEDVTVAAASDAASDKIKEEALSACTSYVDFCDLDKEQPMAFLQYNGKQYCTDRDAKYVGMIANSLGSCSSLSREEVKVNIMPEKDKTDMEAVVTGLRSALKEACNSFRTAVFNSVTNMCNLNCETVKGELKASADGVFSMIPKCKSVAEKNDGMVCSIEKDNLVGMQHHDEYFLMDRMGSRRIMVNSDCVCSDNIVEKRTKLGKPAVDACLDIAFEGGCEDIKDNYKGYSGSRKPSASLNEHNGRCSVKGKFVDVTVETKLQRITAMAPACKTELEANNNSLDSIQGKDLAAFTVGDKLFVMNMQGGFHSVIDKNDCKPVVDLDSHSEFTQYPEVEKAINSAFDPNTGACKPKDHLRSRRSLMNVVKRSKRAPLFDVPKSRKIAA